MQDNQTRTESGKIALKGEMYHLIIAGSDITFDGKNTYTYIKESNEINITKPEPSKPGNGDLLFSNPRELFKIKNEFKSKLLKETNIGNVLCYEIDLYPINLKTKYLRIRIHVDKTTYQIINTKVFMKDGTSLLIEFSNFQPNVDIANGEFLFDQKKYPGAAVNDMRF
jgi:outer membrane lipoprotein-sorting protein